MIIENISYGLVLEWINKAWARSLSAVIALCLGLWIGSINTESRIVNDCKFAGSFRVDIQAFACQRKI